MSQGHDQMRVRGVKGRFIPSGNLGFFGWRECCDGDCPDAVLPAGHGPLDTDVRAVTITDLSAQGGCRTIKLEKKIHGHELRLVITECYVPNDPVFRRAVRDGDLELVKDTETKERQP